MKSKEKNPAKNTGPVPYDSLSPGFEAIYTGRSASPDTEKVEIITTLTGDSAGHEIRKWSVVSWTWPGGEAEWDAEIPHLHSMQSELGELDEATRRIRAHIGSLVPCDSGVPVTVDELLHAIGTGKLNEPSFHNGCWCPGMWWEQRTTQPFHTECMETIHAVLTGYLAGKDKDHFSKEFPGADAFIQRTYEWLGPVDELKDYQELLIERVLLTIDYFANSSYRDPLFSDEAKLQQGEARVKDLFEEGGQGERLDREIAEKADLPRIYPRWKPEYQETLDRIEDSEKQALYQSCCAVASGVYTLSDCHHNTFRFIEGWIHGIGTGELDIPTRQSGTERERLGQLLFGYVLGLDKWLLGRPLPFLLLDLGHMDFGFDPRNEILRVYAYLGEERTLVKEWLAACLWHTLYHSPIAGNPGGLVRHTDLLERAEKARISTREWMDSVMEG